MLVQSPLIFALSLYQYWCSDYWRLCFIRLLSQVFVNKSHTAPQESLFSQWKGFIQSKGDRLSALYRLEIEYKLPVEGIL